jgi:glycosyltransferase involved in cell wall biosynthesis
MKKVLIIAYYFPPMGMGGVQRAVKFVKYLPEFGWKPIVVTVKDVAYYANDNSLLKEVESANIIRTESLDPLRLYKKTSKLKRQSIKKISNQKFSFSGKINQYLLPFLILPDSKVLWLPWAISAAEKIIKSQHVDLVMTTSPPHSAHLAGLWFKLRNDLSWIADFRDQWPTEVSQKLPTPIHRSLDHWIARKVLLKADKIISVSNPITDQLHKNSRRKRKHFDTLSNGFDKKDFDIIQVDRSEKKFIVTYCGTISKILNPVFFFSGLKLALNQRPDLRENICVRFIGSILDVDLESLIHHYRLDNIIEREDYVSHHESVRYLIESDMLLFLLSENLSEGMVTGKIFEYIAAGKPIMALAPHGEAERLILNHARGIVIPPTDTENIAAEFIRCYELWKRGDLKITVPRWKGLEQFERKNQTEKLAMIFEDTLQQRL